MCLWYELYSHRIIPYTSTRSRSNFLHDEMCTFRYQHLLALFGASISPIKKSQDMLMSETNSCELYLWTTLQTLWQILICWCSVMRLQRMSAHLWGGEAGQNGAAGVFKGNVSYEDAAFRFFPFSHWMALLHMTSLRDLLPARNSFSFYVNLWWAFTSNNIFSSKLTLVDSSPSQIHTLALVAFWFWIIVGYTIWRKYDNLSRMKLVGNINSSTVNFTELWSMQIANWSSCLHICWITILLNRHFQASKPFSAATGMIRPWIALTEHVKTSLLTKRRGISRHRGTLFRLVLSLMYLSDTSQIGHFGVPVARGNRLQRFRIFSKGAVTNAPVRGYTVPGAPYRLYFDACDFGLAAIL